MISLFKGCPQFLIPLWLDRVLSSPCSCLKSLPHRTSIHSRKVKRFLGTDPQKAACLRSVSSRKNDGSSPASWPSAVLAGAARSWQGIHPREFLLLISLEPSGQAGVGQMMCQVTRTWCYHIFGGGHMRGGQLGLLPPGVRSLWWDMCHLPCCRVLQVLEGWRGVISQHPNVSVFLPQSASSPPLKEPERTTINKWNEKCNPVFVLKGRVEITDSL